MCIIVVILFISWKYPGESHCGSSSQEVDSEAEDIKYMFR